MKHIVTLMAALLIAGCQTYDPADQAKLARIKQTIPICTIPAECEAKWEAAQLWVVRNAGYKIQLATSVLIETYNSTQSSTALAVQVVKEPAGGGNYRFLAKAWCANWIGCFPDPYDAMLDFNQTLNAVRL